MNTEQNAQSAPASIRISRTNSFPHTKTIIILNFLVFIAMGSPAHPTQEQLIRWGASFGPLTLGGEWWRMATSLFVHNGFAHLVGNMVILLIVGKMVEPFLNRWSFFCLYLITGIAGTTLSLAMNPEILTCGASGPMFGMIGAALIALSTGRLPLSEGSLKVRLVLLTAFVALSFYYRGFPDSVDDAAHLGGLLSGLILGTLLIRRRSTNELFNRRLFAIAAAAMLLMTLVIRWQNGWVRPLGIATKLAAKGRLDEAQKALLPMLHDHPLDVTANLKIGEIYFRKGDLANAEISLKRALARAPKNRRAEYLLGVVYLQADRFDEALKCAEELIDIEHPYDADVDKLFAASLEGTGNHETAGYSYLGLKQYDDAISSFRSALRDNPNNEHAKQGLISAYRAQGMKDKADEIERTASPSASPRPSPTQHL